MADPAKKPQDAPKDAPKDERPKGPQSILFNGPSDEYIYGLAPNEILFVKGAPSIKVDADVAETLLAVIDQNFEVADAETLHEEKRAAAQAAKDAAAAEKAAIAAQIEADEDARRRGVYYGAQSQADIDTLGDTGDDSQTNSDESGDNAEPSESSPKPSEDSRP